MRCMPQVHGAFRDALEHVGRVVEREMNAATDNPLVFADTEEEARAVLGRIAALAPAGALAVEEVLPMSFESLYEATATSFYAGERYAVDSQWSVDAGSLMFRAISELVSRSA